MSKQSDWMAGLSKALLLVLGLPVALRLFWLWVGPPIVNLSLDPKIEFERLSSNCQSDLIASRDPYKHIQQLGLERSPAVMMSARFFCRPNTEKYAECFLELAKHHFDDPDFAKQALYKAITLDSGWNGQQAVGIFVSKFADETQYAGAVCQALTQYEPRFAKTQLRILANQTHDHRLHAVALIALANLHKKAKEHAEARVCLDEAMAQLKELRQNQQAEPEAREKPVLNEASDNSLGKANP